MTLPADPSLHPAGDSAWFVRRPRKHAARVRLICFHHAGGNANAFLPWAAALPVDIEIIGIQLPGRGVRQREPVLRDSQALISTLGPLLAGELLQGPPFHFFGHSTGAWLAFEMARWLAARGARLPEHLFVCGRAAPHLPFRIAPIDSLPDTEMAAQLQRFGGIDDALLSHPELMRLLMPVIRADLFLHRSHRHIPQPPLGCPLTALVADDDPLCTVQDARAWEVHTRDRFELKVMTGGHFFFLREPGRYLPLLFPPACRGSKP